MNPNESFNTSFCFSLSYLSITMESAGRLWICGPLEWFLNAQICSWIQSSSGEYAASSSILVIGSDFLHRDL